MYEVEIHTHNPGVVFESNIKSVLSVKSVLKNSEGRTAGIQKDDILIAVCLTFAMFILRQFGFQKEFI